MEEEIEDIYGPYELTAEQHPDFLEQMGFRGKGRQPHEHGSDYEY